MSPTLHAYTSIILVWWSVSPLSYLFATVWFFIWLRQHGISLIFGLTGTPGYMEYRYWVWCARHGVTPSRTLWLRMRLLLLVNVLLSCIFAFPILSHQFHD